MTDETTHKTTYDAMVAVMREIEHIAKGRKADSSMGGYAFRGYEDVLEALGPACRKHGLLTIPVSGEAVMGEYQTKGGSVMHWPRVPLEIHFRGSPNPDDVIVARMEGEAADTADKAASKAQSVAYREIMLKTFVVPVLGMGYDTEEGEDRSAAAPPPEDEFTRRGWESGAAMEKAWATLRDTTKGLPDGEATESLREATKAMKLTKGTFTPEHYSAWEQNLAGVNRDTGDWNEGYEPY